MKTKILFGCILLLSFLAQGLRAQDTAFWFVAPHMSTMSYLVSLNYPAFLAISNGTFQTANIEITLYNGGDTKTYTSAIAPGGLYRLDFGNATIIKQIENPRDKAGSVVKYGTHIRSDVKVTAYYMMNSSASRDIFTLKGHQALGTQFYVPMQSDNAAKSLGTYQGYDQIDIVATEDATQVTVVPKARIRLATENPPLARADTTIIRMLNKGETLKILEYDYDENPSLAGTSITATKPIAVTVTEDLVAGDTSGDQIVPVNSLGTRYVVPRGYLDNHANKPELQERFYLVATVPDTHVEIYTAAGTNNSPTQTITLNAAGGTVRYTFPSNVYAIYVKADHPVYVYQRSGYAEEGAAVLPSIYAIGQTQVAFYQTAVAVQKGFVVFRTGTESSFTVSYGSASPAPLSLVPLDIPNEADWKIALFDFAALSSGGQVVKVQSTQSAFSLGYITGNAGSDDAYGYFSAFGTFEFPATTWMCGSSVTLEGGYARSYLWTFPDGSTATTSSIVATQEGVYTLVMDQDPNIVTATTTVQKVNAGAISPGEQVICTGETPAPLSVTGASELTGTQYQWQFSLDNVNWTNLGGATLSGYSPGALTQTTWYRRGMSSDLCGMAYTYAVKVRVSSCTLPVNPHLMGRFRGGGL